MSEFLALLAGRLRGASFRPGNVYAIAGTGESTISVKATISVKGLTPPSGPPHLLAGRRAAREFQQAIDRAEAVMASSSTARADFAAAAHSHLA